MAVLQPNEYNASYFDGRDQPLRHNAGYSNYKRWYRYDGKDSLGEFYKDKAYKLNQKYRFTGKVLEVGCAKGFIVEDLRSFGVDAWGLDVSSYAIGQSSNEVAPYLRIGDARTALSIYGNKEFNFLFSLRFIECFTDSEIPALITEFNRIARKQFHIIDEFTGGKIATYYNAKSITDWLKQSWQTKTELIAEEDESKSLIK